MVRPRTVNRILTGMGAAAVLGFAASSAQAYDLRVRDSRWKSPGSIGIVSCYYQCHVNRASNSPSLYKVCVNNLTGAQVSVTWVGSKC